MPAALPLRGFGVPAISEGFAAAALGTYRLAGNPRQVVPNAGGLLVATAVHAQFPEPLCRAFVDAIQCLFDLGQPMQACTLQQALESVPPRPVDSFPRATQDGAGIFPGLVGAASGARGRLQSSPCGSSCMHSSCNAKPHLACVRLLRSIARIRYLRSPRLLICGKCGSNGPTPWATQVHLIGRLHLANRMQLSHWHAWQPCWGIRM